ncbi:uncharacterized protein LOC106883402 isoform X1 [Octopus bimaculoides]|uniref:DUF3987 domain-containing protein n=1 Tax=Octopus bimaculoides TaxID=37653 RepID=A0A0L8FH58_OCTBM|nr:uncharacterized protein LOC106883402 isoform X1 [Octopus bimaculoides]|eukprot:XP_014789880.1 PREDICTED: uncharacterized protein LOC106883402 [Octopus bimaculoides]
MDEGRPGGTSTMAPSQESGTRQFNWQDCYKTAQMVPLLDLALVGSYNIRRLVTNHANAIGCPSEYIFLPLLSCTAALMGRKTKIKVNQLWQEPPVVWTMIGAYPGTRKSAALRQLMTPLLEIQRELEKQWHLSRPTSPGAPPHSGPGPQKLIAGPMTHEDLSHVLRKNSGQILCFAEDLHQLHKMLELDQENSKGPDQLLVLYDGGPMFHVENGEMTTLDSTCFNHTGMGHPKYVVDLFLNGQTWLSSRYLVACPHNPNFSTIWNSIPLTTDTPPMKTIFQTLHTYHQQNREYVFSTEAWKDLCRVHDEEWASMVSQLDHDERRRSAIEKSLGQIVRMAGVLKALMNACEFTMQATNPAIYEWDLVIDSETLHKAIELSKYFMEQKLALMLVSGMSLGLQPSVNVSAAAAALQQQQQYCAQAAHSASQAAAAAAVVSQQQQQQVQQQAQQQSNQQVAASSQQQQQQNTHNSSAVLSIPPTPAQSTALGVLPSGIQTSPSTQNLPLPPINSLPKEWDQPQVVLADDDYEIPFIPEFYTMDKASFITNHGKRMKRLLECYDDGTGVSATTAAQKSIAPPVKQQATNNRHPVWVSVLFFKKVSEFGVGAAERIKHPSNKKVYWRFKRKHPLELDEKNKQMLQYLRVDMNLYNKIGSNVYETSSPGPPPVDVVDNSDVVDENSTGGSSSAFDPSFSVKQELVQLN